MNHLTLLAAFKLCVLTHGRKSGLFEIRADHVTCLARDLFHSPPDPLCPTSPGAWNLEAESPWLESAERKSSPAWAKTCLVTASLFVKWDQLIVAQRAFKALGWGWWSLCKWLSVQRPWTLNFRHAGTFWACRQSLWCALFDQTIAGKNWLHFRHPSPGPSHTPAPVFCMYSSPCLDTLLLDALPSAYQQFAPVFHLVHRRCVVLSRVWLSETGWTGAHQALLSMGYPRQGYWNGLPFPSPGHLGSNPYLLHWQADSLPLSHPGSPIISFQITSLETFQLLSLSLPCFVLLHSTISLFYVVIWLVICGLSSAEATTLSIALSPGSKVAPICRRPSRNISWIMNEWRKYLP